jgi:hypothetical protein
MGKAWSSLSSGAYTRGGAAREKRQKFELEFGRGPTTRRGATIQSFQGSLGSQGFPVGENTTKKKKEWETGLTIRDRSTRYGATLEPSDGPPIVQPSRGEGCNVFFFFFVSMMGADSTRSQEELTSQKLVLMLEGCGNQHFSPGGSGSCAFLQTGNGAGALMNRACQSFAAGRRVR